MDYLYILFIWMFTLARSSSGQQHGDWSCNFDSGDCDIEQVKGDNGKWITKTTYFFADFNWLTSDGAFVDCTLPLKFHATNGRMSVMHYSNNGKIQLRYCEGGEYNDVNPTNSNRWMFFNSSITCPLSSKIEISIRAVRSSSIWRPDIRIDDLEVFGDMILSTTDHPSTSWKSTSGITQSTSSSSSNSANQSSTKGDTTSGSTLGSTSVSSSTSSSTSSIYHTTTVPSSSISDTTSITSPNHVRTTESGRPRTFKTTDTLPKTTLNSTLPNRDPKGVPIAFIASISVILPVLFVVTVIVFIGYRRRGVPQQMDSQLNGDHGKRADDHIYTNQAFSAKDVNMSEPDVIRDAHGNNGLAIQHYSSSNHQGSSRRLCDNGSSGYGAENSSVEGDYTDLRTPEEEGNLKEDGGQEYFVLERTGGMDDIIQGTGVSLTDANVTAYDHLDRDIVQEIDQEQLHDIHYGAVADMSDDTHYNALVHGNEAIMNQRRGSDRSSLKNSGQDTGNEYGKLNFAKEKESTTHMDDSHYSALVHGNRAVTNQRRSTDGTILQNNVLESGQGAGNVYGRLNLAEEKESRPIENMNDNHYNSLVHGNEAGINQRCIRDNSPNKTVPDIEQGPDSEYGRLNFATEKGIRPHENMDDNHYNVLGETDADRIGSRGKASTGKDTTQSEDELYSHIDQLGDYNLYQDPEEDVNRDPTTNDNSKRDEDENVYCEPAMDGQGKETTEGDTKAYGTPLSQEGEEVPDDDYYSNVNFRGQVNTPGDGRNIQHEPIYSSDVYSELDL